jgi:hypothetical protein
MSNYTDQALLALLQKNHKNIETPIYNQKCSCKRQGYISVELKECESCKNKCLQYLRLNRLIEERRNNNEL